MCHACAEHILHINLFPDTILFLTIIVTIIIANIHGVFVNCQALH